MPAAPVRRALEVYLEETGEPVSRVAEAIGFVRTLKSGRQRGRVAADTSRLKRAVGMMPRRTRGTQYRGRYYGDYSYVNRTVDYDLAVKICLAIGADPTEVGV